MIDYIIENKEWLFSGLGIFIITIIVSFVRRERKSSNSVKIKGSSNKIRQVGSKTENHIEIEGDMNDVNQP